KHSGRSTLIMIGCPPVGAALGAGSFGFASFWFVTLPSLYHCRALIIRGISALDGPAISLAFCAASSITFCMAVLFAWAYWARATAINSSEASFMSMLFGGAGAG